MTERFVQLVQTTGNSLSASSLDPDRYLQPRQAQRRAPTNYEDLLGDAIERAYSSGVTELGDLVDSLNQQGITTTSGESWTVANYGPELAVLGG